MCVRQYSIQHPCLLRWSTVDFEIELFSHCGIAVSQPRRVVTPSTKVDCAVRRCKCVMYNNGVGPSSISLRKSVHNWCHSRIFVSLLCYEAHCQVAENGSNGRCKLHATQVYWLCNMSSARQTLSDVRIAKSCWTSDRRI